MSRLRYGDVYSDSEEEEDDEEEEDLTVKPNDYIIIRFTQKKTERHYVGLVTEYEDDELTVKFMRKTGLDKFVFPEVDDVATIDRRQVVKILSQPVVNHRHVYIFNENLAEYNNLC